ncbi:hypothetical protein [Nitrosopumilus ureiphilus]|uniref:Nitrosopumilus output domain-containing protein n=1 Tax=Nitrosopumilus ureiphilus TaxID=1470067 RepID=A0A7D5M7H0_9ARCH|nr:hypothetical protein [Nitrosopumilus ureiphilus]QLH06308.1 hypothetical protein C5F50_03875 [Nitrosopumilus ureiphilus]
MAFKVKYRFVDEEKYHTCVLTLEQFKNFRELPVVEECEIVKNTKEYKDYQEKMQKAINLAVKNNTTHILKLSENA